MLKNFCLPGIIVAGCDEAGRGCLAGPVFAAAVILPENYSHPFLNDSKQLTLKQREKLRREIEYEAIEYSADMAEVNEIDSLNIANASYLAVHRAIEKLKSIPGHILMDGNRFTPYRHIPFTCVVKGDSTWLNIAAASVIAKTYRDEYMLTLHEEFPEYGWDRNKGYPTLQHRKAIIMHGLTPYHRRTFRQLNEQLELPFDTRTDVPSGTSLQNLPISIRNLPKKIYDND
jgi:ribonuclease HII